MLKVLLSILAQVCDHLEDKPVDDLGAGEDADPCADPQQAADVGDQVKHRHPPVGLVLCQNEIEPEIKEYMYLARCFSQRRC